MKNLLRSLAVLTLALPLSLLAESGRKTVEKSFSLVPDKDLKVGIKLGEATIESVRIRNWPDSEEFEKGEKDLNDKHTLVFDFTYSNRNEDRDYKCLYKVTITGPNGVAGENDRKATLDKGKIGDTNKVMVKLKTHLIKKIKSFKVSFEIWQN